MFLVYVFVKLCHEQLTILCSTCDFELLTIYLTTLLKDTWIASLIFAKNIKQKKTKNIFSIPKPCMVIFSFFLQSFRSWSNAKMSLFSTFMNVNLWDNCLVLHFLKKMPFRKFFCRCLHPIYLFQLTFLIVPM